MTDRLPHLADVRCTPMRFQPGDRILVKVYTNLSAEQERKLRRVVERWAGGICEVLIINANTTEIQVEHPTRKILLGG